MTLESLSILIYTLLIFAAVLVQGVYSSRTAGPAFGFSNREDDPPGMRVAGLRIDRTLANLKEGAIMYLPLALLAVWPAAGFVDTGLGLHSPVLERYGA